MASKSERIQYEDHLVESTAAHDKEDSETQLKRVQSEFRIATGNSLVETPRLADSHVSSYESLRRRNAHVFICVYLNVSQKFRNLQMS